MAPKRGRPKKRENEKAPVVAEAQGPEGSRDPRDHVLKTDEATAKVRKKLIKTGRYSELTSALSLALVECGWKTDVENYCRLQLRKNPQLTHRQLVERVRIDARNLVPSSIKHNLAEHIKTCYMEPEPPKDISPPRKTSLTRDSSSAILCSSAKRKSPQTGVLSNVQKKSSQDGKLNASKNSSDFEEMPRTQEKSAHSGVLLSAQKTSSHSGKLNTLKKSSDFEETSRTHEKSAHSGVSSSAQRTSSHSGKSNTQKKSSDFEETSSTQKKSAHSGESSSVDHQGPATK